MEDLASLRAKIDAIDDELLRLLNERAQCAQAIGHLKSGPIYRPEREAQVLARIAQENAGPLQTSHVQQIFRNVMSACLALERPLSVAFLGPEGTFSQAAAIKQFGAAATAAACASIDDVFRQVESEAVDYGIVPVENSTEGAIGRSLDLMMESPLKVCGETLLRVHHNLMARDEQADLASIKSVYSHAQSLGQCQEWLNKHLPGAARVPVASNAEAARRAASEAGSAAIAGEHAAHAHGLKVLRAHIQDQSHNTTRFLVLGRYEAAPSGKDKTSLVMSTKNRPGAMHDLLTPLADNGVSMTKMESRPSRTGLWEYVFFVDIEGHCQDARVARALDQIRERALFVKVLGSYPAAVH
jgi:chorismate mutase / prephenate dehydratase